MQRRHDPSLLMAWPAEDLTSAVTSPDKRTGRSWPPWANWLGVLPVITTGFLLTSSPASGAVAGTEVPSVGFARLTTNALSSATRATGFAKSSVRAQVTTFNNPDLVYAVLGFGVAATCVVLFIIRRILTIQESLVIDGSSDQSGKLMGATAVEADPATERVVSAHSLNHRQLRALLSLEQGWGPIVVAIILASTTAALGFAGAITGEAVATILGAMVGYVVAKSQSG